MHKESKKTFTSEVICCTCLGKMQYSATLQSIISRPWQVADHGRSHESDEAASASGLPPPLHHYPHSNPPTTNHYGFAVAQGNHHPWPEIGLKGGGA